MGKLKEFLSREAKKLRDEATAEAEADQRWNDSTDQLFETLESWIREADSNKDVEVKRSRSIKMNESKPISVLKIVVGLRRVRISASSRRVAGLYHLPGEPSEYKPEGLVVVEGGEHTYRLYLFRLGGKDRWFLQTHGMNLQSLDRELFESLITTTLQ
jgi:hypothetical protein